MMKAINRQWMLALAAAGMFSLAACDTDVDITIQQTDAPVFVSSTPATGDDKVSFNDITIEVSYDKNVFFATKDLDKLSFTGGTLVSAEVIGSSNVLTVQVNVPTRATACSLTIPAGVVTGPNQMACPEVKVDFSTIDLQKTPNAATTAGAVKLYQLLLDNFESKTLSGMMANVAWNHDCADQVFAWTGEHPAINTFDYVHMPASEAGANWINYTDITPVSEWAAAGGIVSCMWHWNVPKVAVTVETSSKEIWTGEQVIPGDWSGSLQLTAGGEADAFAAFAEAEVGQVIRVATKDVAAGAQGSLKNSSWTEIASGTEYFDITGDFTLTITDEVLTSLKEGGLIVSGHDYTITGIYLETPATELDPNSDYAFYKADTEFDAANALTEGTWENAVYKRDIETIISYLTLLRDANIDVLWRPFHEAAGGWFWWGKNADSFKALWVDMFNRFKAAGLNNLIWVWTTETGDDDWYPGDEYVDIVSRDLYSKDADTAASEYGTIAWTYGSKMVSLSECGSVGTISEQWTKGARWSWFMPWYDGTDDAGNPVVHADEAWWKDAMSQNYVISREDLQLGN